MRQPKEFFAFQVLVGLYDMLPWHGAAGDGTPAVFQFIVQFCHERFATEVGEGHSSEVRLSSLVIPKKRYHEHLALDRIRDFAKNISLQGCHTRPAPLTFLLYASQGFDGVT
jgi:hypothetical protein